MFGLTAEPVHQEITGSDQHRSAQEINAWLPAGSKQLTIVQMTSNAAEELCMQLANDSALLEGRISQCQLEET